MKTPEVIILCGLPCSGKSTFCSAMEFDNHMHLSTDAYIEQVAKLNKKTYNDVWASTIKEAAKVFFAMMNVAATTNQNVIIDQTNLSVATRKLKINLFKNHHPIIAYFDRPLELINQRNIRPGKTIPDYVLDSMNKQLQPPTSEEAELWTL